MAKQAYIKANQEWLEEKAKEKGIYYKVLKHGDANSATPSPRSIVTAH